MLTPVTTESIICRLVCAVRHVGSRYKSRHRTRDKTDCSIIEDALTSPFVDGRTELSGNTDTHTHTKATKNAKSEQNLHLILSIRIAAPLSVTRPKS
jgi:hypothetical protein